MTSTNRYPCPEHPLPHVSGADLPNRYAPPTATVADGRYHSGTQPRLAERGTRLGAAVIDEVVIAVPIPVKQNAR